MPVAQVSQLVGAPRRTRRGRAWAIGGAVLLLAVAGAAFLVLRYATGEVSAAWVRDRLAERLEPALGAGVRLDLKSAVIDRENGETRLVLNDFAAHAADGRRILGAPQAVVTFDPLSAAIGRFAPQRIDLVGLDVRVRFGRDGVLDISTDPVETAAIAPAAPAAPDEPRPSAAAAAAQLLARLAAAIDLLNEGASGAAAFETFGLRRGRLVLQDPDRGQTMVLSDIAADMQRGADGAHRIRLSGAGRSGRWQLDAQISRKSNGARRLQAQVEGLSPADVAEALRGSLPDQADARIALSGAVEIGPQGDLSVLEGVVALTGLTAPRLGKFAPPFAVERIAGKFAFDPAAGRIDILRIDVAAGASRLALAGGLSLDEAGRLVVALASADGEIAPAGERLQPVTIAEANGRLVLDPNAVTLEAFSASGPEFKVDLRALMDWSAANGRYELDVKGSTTSASAAFGLWPRVAAGDVRDYLVPRWTGGRLEALDLSVRMTWAEALEAFGDGPAPDHAVKGRVVIGGGAISLLADAPPLEVETVEGAITGRTSALVARGGSIRTGGGHRLQLKDVVMNFGARDIPVGKPHPADVGFALAGTAPGLAELLDTPAIAAMIGADIPTGMTKGRADLKISIGFPLKHGLKPTDFRLEGAGTLADLTIEKALAGEALHNANLAVKFDRSALTLKGDASVQGAPATIDFRMPLRGGGAGEAVIALRIDDALRAKRGWGGQGLSGPLTATLKAPVGVRDPKAKVEIDLSRAAISGWVPGWSKPAGRPGKATFTIVRRGGGVDLADFTADAAGLALSGLVSLDGNFAFRSARFDKARLSPGDVGKLDIERAGPGWKATVRASVIDARPFLASLLGGKGDDGDKTPFDLDLRSEIVTGHYAEALSNVDLKFSRAGGDVKTLRLAGRFGASPVTANLARRDDGAVVAVLQSANAGAALRFGDFYRRMQGGAMVLQSTLGGQRQDGVLSIRNFSLADEPALKRVLSDPGISRLPGDRADLTPAPRASAEGAVRFDRLRADFRRAGNRLELTEAVMWGPVIGASIEGWLDFGRGALNITGTFVPAYALNNIFAKVPVLGFFLGGGEHGGLFAVNFKVTGPIARPQLAVNPLSAIAPGFLRKFFEFSRATDQEPPPARVVDPGSQR